VIILVNTYTAFYIFIQFMKIKNFLHSSTD